jgi:hypothetical protein
MDEVATQHGEVVRAASSHRHAMGNNSTVNVNLPMSASAKSSVPVLVSMMISQHLREVTSANDPMEYDRGLTVVQAQLVQRVQSLLLDLLLEDPLSIDHMLSRYGQANSWIRIVAGYSQIYLRTIATKPSGTSGVEAPVHVVWGVSCYQPVFVLVVSTKLTNVLTFGGKRTS